MRNDNIVIGFSFQNSVKFDFACVFTEFSLLFIT